MTSVQADKSEVQAGWRSVADIPGFPFTTFKDLKAAVSKRDFSIGVEPLAAAEWSDESRSKLARGVISALSVLMIAAAVAAVVSAFWLGNYYLLSALPVMAVAFYYSQPESPIRKWVTMAGVGSIIVIFELLLNGFPTAALLVAYAGLTFAVVRLAGFITGSAFRKAILSDEELFLMAYGNSSCMLRDNRAGCVYGHDAARGGPA